MQKEKSTELDDRSREMIKVEAQTEKRADEYPLILTYI
jgi:hypothetical protein